MRRPAPFSAFRNPRFPGACTRFANTWADPKPVRAWPMNDKSFEAKLARVSAPAPDPAARLRAKRAALEEFARVQAASQASGASANEKTSDEGSKGLWDALRLFRDDSSHGSTSMAWFVRRNLFAGVAGACVVGLGIAMVWPVFRNYGDPRLFEDLQPPPVTVELKPQA